MMMRGRYPMLLLMPLMLALSSSVSSCMAFVVSSNQPAKGASWSPITSTRTRTMLCCPKNRPAFWGVTREDDGGCRMMTAINANSNGMEVQLSPRQLVRQGMDRFRGGDMAGSIDSFDLADRAVPDGSLRPFLWQRGISYYYANQFEKGSQQFRYDVKVNPLDVEEIVWDIACLSRLDPTTMPPSTMMSLPPGKKDSRRIMGTVYSLFRGEATEHDLVSAGHNSSMSDEFYSLFYLGLFCESRGETSKAESYMKSAAKSQYAQGTGSVDYMTACAKIHCQLRHWA